MAKINFSTVLMSMEGEPLKDDKKNDLTLGGAAKQSLLFFDEKESGDVKYDNYCLATKVYGQGETTLKSEEITKIKKAVGKYMGAIVIGQAWNLLEGKPIGFTVEDKPSDATK